MQHSNIRRKNEKVEIFSFSKETNIELKIWKFRTSSNLTPLPNTYVINQIKSEYYQSVITTPDEDCYLLIEFGKQPIVIRVGDPSIYFLFHTYNKKDYHYKQYLNTGHMVDSGDLINITENFYCKSPLFKGSSIFEVYNNEYKEPFKITTPYPKYFDNLTPCSLSNGSIEIEPNVWQLLAIPVEFGYWDRELYKLIHDTDVRSNIYNYVITQLEDKYNANGNELIEVVNTYIGDNNYFWNFIPGITNLESDHNFNLIYNDGKFKEVVGFWIKSIHSSNMILEWGCNQEFVANPDDILLTDSGQFIKIRGY